MESTENLLDLIKKLQERIEKLEEENIETTNCLYEIQIQIDQMNMNEFNLQNYSLGES